MATYTKPILVVLLTLTSVVSLAAGQFDCSKNSSRFIQTNKTIDVGALKAYYELATTFLHSVSQNREIDPDQVKQIIQYFQNTTQVTLTNLFTAFEPLISDQIAFIVLLAFGIIYVILFPLAGLIFCGCRLCGKCGGQKYQERSSTCLCSLFSFLVIICAVVFGIATVLYGFNNNRLYKELETSPSEFTNQMKYAADYVDDLSDTLTCSIQSAYQKDYGEASKTEGNLSDRFVALVMKISGMEGVRNVQMEVEEMNYHLKQLEAHQDNLCKQSTELNLSISNFNNSFEKSQLGKDYGDMHAQEIEAELSLYCQLTRLPRANSTANFTEETQIYIDNLKGETDQMQKKVDEAFKEMDKVNETIQSTISQIHQTTGDISKTIEELRGSINGSVVQAMRDFSNRYSWLEYIGLVLVLPTALITVFLLLGLLCGLCNYKGGKAPYDRPCLSEFGGCSLMAAVGLIFLFSWLIMIVTMGVFTIGYVGETQFCQPLFKNPTPSILDLIPNMTVNTEKGEVTVNVKQVLDGCKENQPIYQVMNLDSAINLHSLLNNVQERVANLSGIMDVNKTFNVSSISYQVDISTIDYLSRQLNESIQPSVDALIIGLPKPNLTITEFSNIVKYLKDKTANGSGSGQFLAEAAAILNSTSSIVALIDDLVRSAAAVSNSTGRIHQMIQIDILPKANNTTNAVLAALNNEADNLKSNMTAPLIDFLAAVNHTVLEEGGCRPLYEVYNNIGNLFCQRMLYPLQGFWFSLGLCLILFIPAVAFGVKLAKYFRKMDETFYSNGRMDEQARWSTSNIEMATRKAW